jgi:prepilin-type N-terminal cleavage/methylation domain-containing protein
MTMTKEMKNQNLFHYGFTLFEMIIVLIIIGIMLLVTLYMSGEQIQKVKDKTVKESIVAEMQSRYSRNL